MSDFAVGGFNSTKPRRRPRTPPPPPPPEVIDTEGHMWKCDLKDVHGHKCTRKPIGPYFDRKYLREAVTRHLRSQHVNTLDVEEKFDSRMWRADKEPTGYEAPSW